MVRAVVVNQKAKNWWETVYMKMEEEDYENAKGGNVTVSRKWREYKDKTEGNFFSNFNAREAGCSDKEYVKTVRGQWLMMRKREDNGSYLVHDSVSDSTIHLILTIWCWFHHFSFSSAAHDLGIMLTEESTFAPQIHSLGCDCCYQLHHAAPHCSSLVAYLFRASLPLFHSSSTITAQLDYCCSLYVGIQLGGWVPRPGFSLCCTSHQIWTRV